MSREKNIIVLGCVLISLVLLYTAKYELKQWVEANFPAVRFDDVPATSNAELLEKEESIRREKEVEEKEDSIPIDDELIPQEIEERIEDCTIGKEEGEYLTILYSDSESKNIPLKEMVRRYNNTLNDLKKSVETDQICRKVVIFAPTSIRKALQELFKPRGNNFAYHPSCSVKKKNKRSVNDILKDETDNESLYEQEDSECNSLGRVMKLLSRDVYIKTYSHTFLFVRAGTHLCEGALQHVNQASFEAQVVGRHEWNFVRLSAGADAFLIHLEEMISMYMWLQHASGDDVSLNKEGLDYNAPPVKGQSLEEWISQKMNGKSRGYFVWKYLHFVQKGSSLFCGRDFSRLAWEEKEDVRQYLHSTRTTEQDLFDHSLTGKCSKHRIYPCLYDDIETDLIQSIWELRDRFRESRINSVY